MESGASYSFQNRSSTAARFTYNEPVDPRSTLSAFDAYLAAHGLELEAVVIGGTALALLGVIVRPTKDCDVLAPLLSAAVREAAREFAEQQRASGLELADDTNPDWPTHSDAVLEDLQRRVQDGRGHGL